jgi:cysteinyl-tRNA synthetase
VTLRLHNTLTGRKEDFRPLGTGPVRVYTCGPTVWNYSHVGNFRAFLFYDLLRRHLRASGFQMLHILNLTDVDDRIIEQAGKAGVSIGEFTKPFERAFFEDMEALRAQAAEIYPRATDHIEEMIVLIERLLEGGHAYTVDGDVYFRISSFPGYGRLSGLDLSAPRLAVRVTTDRYEKESATDFALWKRARFEDERVGAAWTAPFGRGRPGWHIECSAMALRYLGETLDLHAGGVDLLFPHHENEIAQAEAATGVPLVRFWLHSGHVTDASGAKMSKSAGSFVTLRDLLAAGHDPLAIRLLLISASHYRSPLTLTEQALHGAHEQLRRLREFAGRVGRAEGVAAVDDAVFYQDVLDARDAYRAALDDDLNLPAGLGHLFELVRKANTALDGGQVGSGGLEALRELLGEVDQHLDVLRGGPLAQDEMQDEEVQRLIQDREAARRARDYALADRIREQLRGRGVAVEDTSTGPRARPAGRAGT